MIISQQPFSPVTSTSGPVAAVAGNSYVVSPNLAVNLPAPAAGALVQITANGAVTGATPVTINSTGGAQIFGVGLIGATRFFLGTAVASATLLGFSTYWLIVEGQQDSGWLPLALITSPGTGVVSGGSYPPTVRLQGDVVRARGVMANQTGGTLTIGSTWATIPAIARPATVVTQTIEVTGVAGIAPVSFGTLITVAYNVTDGNEVVLDGMTYTIS